MNTMQYSNFKKRFIAWIIDFLILFFVCYFLGQIYTWFIFTGYSIGFLLFNKGQTIGKKLMKIKVVSENGNLSIYQVFFRETIGRMLSILTFGIGYLLIFFDKKKRSLYDKIAQTLVIYE